MIVVLQENGKLVASSELPVYDDFIPIKEAWEIRLPVMSCQLPVYEDFMPIKEAWEIGLPVTSCRFVTILCR